MVAEGQDVILDVWWLSLFPGLAITTVVLAFNFFWRLVARLSGSQVATGEVTNVGVW
jgi:ABC-type dipeptide/oligopeptide/nickel transport system permease subunit